LSKRTGLNAALAVASVVGVLGLAELTLQVLDFPPRAFSPWIRAEDTAYRHAPGLQMRMRRPPEYDVEFRTSALGLRDDAIGEKRGYRVLLLGDSFTSGYGVERGELFADLLEADTGTEVINAGVGGYEIVHQLHYYRGRGKAFDPDLVIYMLYLGNDLTRNDEWRETSAGGLESVDRPFPVRLRREIKLARLLGQARYGMRERSARKRGEWEPFDDYLAVCERELDEEATGDYEAAGRRLLALRDAVSRSGAELIVVLFSYRTTIDPEARARFAAKTPGFDSRYDLDQPERRITRLLDEAGVTVHTLNPALRSYYEQGAPQGPLYFPIDGHFTVAGHRVVADTLVPLVEDGITRAPTTLRR